MLFYLSHDAVHIQAGKEAAGKFCRSDKGGHVAFPKHSTVHAKYFTGSSQDLTIPVFSKASLTDNAE